MLVETYKQSIYLIFLIKKNPCGVLLVRRGAQFVHIGMPTLCLKKKYTNIA